jgi:SAM-dependent MidA family methyltransferase
MPTPELSNAAPAGPAQAALMTLIRRQIAQAGGWLPFDRFMALALYAPGLGYYANASRKFGHMPETGSDFVTAPELSPWFGRTLAVQVAEALTVTDTREVWEFGAGTGALALQLLDTLGERVQRYTIVDVSGNLRARQQDTLAAHADKVHWVDHLPEQMQGVVVGNEVLDAMPVQLLVRQGGVWHERGVVWSELGPTAEGESKGTLAYADRPTDARPPVEIEGEHDYLTEIHPQGEAFVRTLADRLTRGAVFLIDYGFPEAEYYHPQRHMGTLMCHQAHRADPDALSDVGAKDITAHVNFTAMALAGQEAGLHVLGYTSQAHFLINCGLPALLEDAEFAQRHMAQKLITEHEMGELFKVIAFGTSEWTPKGFASGDRTHRL